MVGHIGNNEEKKNHVHVRQFKSLSSVPEHNVQAKEASAGGDGVHPLRVNKNAANQNSSVTNSKVNEIKINNLNDRRTRVECEGFHLQHVPTTSTTTLEVTNSRTAEAKHKRCQSKAESC